MTPPQNPTPTAPNSSPTPTTPASKGENTKAIIALVLGILSLICCGFFTGIPAIFVGRSELKAIDQGLSPEGNRTLAKVGFILGIVGTILSLLGTLAYIGIIVVAIMSGGVTNSTF